MPKAKKSANATKHQTNTNHQKKTNNANQPTTTNRYLPIRIDTHLSKKKLSN